MGVQVLPATIEGLGKELAFLVIFPFHGQLYADMLEDSHRVQVVNGGEWACGVFVYGIVGGRFAPWDVGPVCCRFESALG